MTKAASILVALCAVGFVVGAETDFSKIEAVVKECVKGQADANTDETKLAENLLAAIKEHHSPKTAGMSSEEAKNLEDKCKSFFTDENKFKAVAACIQNKTKSV